MELHSAAFARQGGTSLSTLLLDRDGGVKRPALVILSLFCILSSVSVSLAFAESAEAATNETADFSEDWFNGFSPFIDPSIIEEAWLMFGVPGGSGESFVALGAKNTTCGDVCLGLGYSGGSCEQNPSVCISLSGTPEHSGNKYCSEGRGGGAGTCCCSGALQCIDGQNQSCYTGPNDTGGVGICVSGLRTCSNNTWGTCVGDVTPAAEICDNAKDDDCDGYTDGDDSDCQECGSGATQACETGLMGICAAGTETCVEGEWGECVQNNASMEEICDNGLDDDCDGQSDSNDTDCQTCQNNDIRPCDTGLIGICAAGTQTCRGHTWGECIANNTAVAEVCDDGLDNDCDGYVDENCTHTVCNYELQVCERVNGAGNDSCTDYLPDCAECIRDTSESCYSGPEGTQGVGICVAGTRSCTEGLWGECADQVTPTEESCNAIDDDCDGLVDECLPGCLDLSIIASVPATADEDDDVILTGTVTYALPKDAFDEECSKFSANSLSTNTTVKIFVDGDLEHEETIPVLLNGTKDVSVEWNADPGDHDVTFVVDPEDSVSEFNEANNEDTDTISVDANQEGGGGAVRGYTFTGSRETTIPLEVESPPEQPEEEAEVGETEITEPTVEAPQPEVIETPTPAVVTGGEFPWWIVLLALAGLFLFFIIWRKKTEYLITPGMLSDLRDEGKTEDISDFAKDNKVYIMGKVPEDFKDLLKPAALKEKDVDVARALARDKNISQQYADAITLATKTKAVIVTDDPKIQNICEMMGVEFMPLEKIEAA